MAKQLPKTIFIDALALVPNNKSGVGKTLENTLRNLLKLENIKDYSVKLLVPLGKAKHLKSYEKDNVSVKSMILPARAIQILLSLKLMPPVDWLLGEGIYIFPNYRNWPLWRSRSLTYIYDIGFKLFPDTVQPKNLKYLQKNINGWLARADMVLTITNQTKYEIEKYLQVPYTQVEVVNCGVDNKVFYRQQNSEILRAKQKYGIVFENYLLFIGNIEPRKNLVALIEAYKKLPQTSRDTTGLVIIGGDGWLNEEFYESLTSAQQQDFNIMKVESYVLDKDLPALYSGASALVQPAVYEGFGMTPLEAMACGTAVAVSKIDSISEVVQDAGCYFDPYDSEAIAKSINQLITDDSYRGKLVAKGLERVHELSWENSAKQLNQVIETEFSRGVQTRPIIKRLKSIYVKADRSLRSILGEKTLQPYRPKPFEDKQALRKAVYNDFLLEQPSHLQTFLIKLYQISKHAAAWPIKKGLQ